MKAIRAKKTNKSVKPYEKGIFNIFNTIGMCIVMLVTVYPMWYALINSLNSGDALVKGYSFFLPEKFTLASWKLVLGDAEIINALWITGSRTIIVTIGSTLITAMFAYGFSRPYLYGRKFFAGLGFISMYFSGGTIATFILVNWLKLYNTYWVYIIPALFGGFYNVIIYNANFKAIPESLFESAKIDGASEFKIFFSIVLPLSKPVLAALGVFTACGVWNDYGTTLFYTQSSSLQTLANYTLKLIKSSQAVEQLAATVMQSNQSVSALVNSSMGSGETTSKTVELAAMVLTTIPVVVAFPFVQKFFTKGVMVGSVKG